MAHRSRNSQSGAQASQRQLRVGELVRHALADILSQGVVHDAVIESHVITVPEVRMSPDLRLATIYVMPLGGFDREKVLGALDAHRKFLRREIAHRVDLKYAPDIRFRIDDTFDEAARIERLLHSPEVARDLQRDAHNEDHDE